MRAGEFRTLVTRADQHNAPAQDFHNCRDKSRPGLSIVPTPGVLYNAHRSEALGRSSTNKAEVIDLCTLIGRKRQILSTRSARCLPYPAWWLRTARAKRPQRPAAWPITRSNELLSLPSPAANLLRGFFLDWEIAKTPSAELGASVNPSVSYELKAVHHGMIRYPCSQQVAEISAGRLGCRALCFCG